MDQERKSELNDGLHEVTFDQSDHPIIDMCCASSCGVSPMGPIYGESLGLALDAIVVDKERIQSSSNDMKNANASAPSMQEGIVASSDFLVQFPRSPYADANHKILLQINGNNIQESILCMSLPRDKSKKMCIFQQGHSTKPPTEVLEQLVSQRILTPGRNLMRYLLVKKNTNTNTEMQSDYIPIAQATAYVFLWSVHDTIIISDIDGTVTKSDVRGVIDTLLTENYGYVHEGVCSLFTELVKYKKQRTRGGNEDNIGSNESQGEVRVLYLSSRPMRLINSTRKFLSLVSQQNQSIDKNVNTPSNCGSFIQSCLGVDISCTGGSVVPATKNKIIEEEGRSSNLPPGPIFLHTGTLSKVLMTELVKKSTHEFKADLLARQVVLPFVCAGKKESGARPLFLAGFGNKKTDLLAYEMVGMNSHHIYIIDKNSVLVSTNSGIEFEAENVDVDGSHDVGSLGRETVKEDLSSNKISVSNPKKKRANLSRNKRRFRGYADPRLRTELLNRIDSQ